MPNKYGITEHAAAQERRLAADRQAAGRVAKRLATETEQQRRKLAARADVPKRRGAGVTFTK